MNTGRCGTTRVTPNACAHPSPSSMLVLSGRNERRRGDEGDEKEEDPFYDDDKQSPSSSSLPSEHIPGKNKSNRRNESNDNDEELLGYAVDSFLRGDYDREFAIDAPAPHPGLTPSTVVDSALRALRRLNDPEPSHGAAVMMRFCLPLSRGERWGDSSSSAATATTSVTGTASRNQGKAVDSWKEVLRGALTPSMFARRLRASEFSGLLDWTILDVTEGACGPLPSDQSSSNAMVGDGGPSIAFVNAALYFGDGTEPMLIQFTLFRRMGGVWLIDTARRSSKELFVGPGSISARKGEDDTGKRDSPGEKGP